MREQHGFTLVEMLLSVSIIVLLVGVSLPVYFNAQTRNDTVTTAETIADALRRAQTYARGVGSDNTWGVNFQSKSATVFQGASYAARVTAYDETLTIPSDMTIGYNGDVVFAEMTGLPSLALSVGLTSSNGETATVTMNAKGMVDY